MQINVNHIPAEGYSETFIHDASFFRELKAIEESGDCRFIAPVKVVFDIAVRIDKRIDIRGFLETEVHLACDKCLESFDRKIETEFSILFSDDPSDFPKDDEVQTEDGHEIQANEIETEFYSGDILELRDAVEEQVIMALPPRAICDDACKGLCIKCGVNLNKAACQCEPDTGHPAFAALKALKK